MRFALITHEDTIFFEDDNVLEVVKIQELWGKDFFRGIYDYDRNFYLDDVDIIDLVGCSICSID